MAKPQIFDLIKKVEELENEMFYKDGDIFSFSSLVVSGYLTSGSTGIEVAITVPKSMKNVDIESINITTSNLRHADGGYIVNNKSYDDVGTTSFSKRTDNELSLTLTLSTASSFTNNSTISGTIAGTITFKDKVQ